MRTLTNPRQFLEPLYRDLVRWDNSFSQAWGSSPSREYVTAFDGVRTRMLRASEELRLSAWEDLRPVAGNIERDAAHMARVSTQLWGMNARHTTFGQGWDRVLDQAVSDVRYALQLLGSDPEAPQPNPNPYPGPYPGPAPVPSPPYPGPYPGPNPSPYPGEPAPWPQPNPYPGDEYGA